MYWYKGVSPTPSACGVPLVGCVTGAVWVCAGLWGLVWGVGWLVCCSAACCAVAALVFCACPAGAVVGVAEVPWFS